MSSNCNIILPIDGVTSKLSSGSPYPIQSKYLSGYFLPAVMPMRAVRPAPNDEAFSSYSPDHYGYVGRETQIRICVQGGAYPYAPVIELAPPGATLQPDPLLPDYMVLKYTPSSEGVYEFRIKVFGQDGNNVIFRWMFTVNSTWCVFISPTGSNDTGDGTFNNPWQTVQYANGVVYNGTRQCVILKDGVYTQDVGSSITSLLSWTPRGAIIDLVSSSTTNGVQFWMNRHHTHIQGIVFKNPPITCANPRWFSTDAVAHWMTMDNCRFEINGRSGTLNNDNISCFFLGNPGGIVTRKYASQTRCEFDGMIGVGNGWSSIDTYNTEFFVVEDNTFTNQFAGNDGSGVLWLKATHTRNGDVRRNHFDNTYTKSVLDCSLSSHDEQGELVTGNVDVCLNVILGTGSITFFRGTGNTQRLPVWSRRNTVCQGSILVYNWGYQTTFTSVGDVIQTTGVNVGDPWLIYYNDTNAGDPKKSLSLTTNMTYSVTNYECQRTSGVIDTNGLLIDAYRTTHLGQRGHELFNPNI